MRDRTSLVLLSGLSGAGRSTAMKALEDLGFYCVDNLPVVLLESFVDLFQGQDRRLAAVVDVREGPFLDDFGPVYDRLLARGVLEELLFLEASDEMLAQRFDETRRVHPAGRGGSLLDGIARERELLGPMAARAGAVIDTSQTSVHELRRRILRRYSSDGQRSALEVEVISFGFRYGAPDVTDLLIDVRFLPNPNFEPALRDRTGLDSEVAAYVLESPRTPPFLKRFFDFLSFLLPLYAEEGKAYLTIAIGCTGGQHRSVAIAGALERYLEERRIEVNVTHRDVERARAGRLRSQPAQTAQTDEPAQTDEGAAGFRGRIELRGRGDSRQPGKSERPEGAQARREQQEPEGDL